MLTEGDIYWIINKFKDSIPKIREIVLNNTEYDNIGSISLRVLNKDRFTTLVPRTDEYTYHSLIDILENYDIDIAKDVLNLWYLFMNSYIVINCINLSNITLDLDILLDRNKVVLLINNMIQIEKELKR